ncbi:MAG TPA: penicillin-binding protein 2 [Candidatus Saccharimonadales bacterium]|nr:penicillin-binding protein 2 [Candidatus Saccharimonadales bacterium]
MTWRSVFERSSLIFAVLFVICGFYIFELFQKQVLEHDQYAEAAATQSTSTTTQPADRGKIIAQDKDGNSYLLAVSEWQYQLLLSPRQVKNPEKLVAALKTQLPNLDTAAALAAIATQKVYVPPVMKGINADDAQKINDQNYAGVSLIPQLARIYPEADKIAAQVLGFVGGDGSGKYGVEATYNDQLTGNPGSQSAKKDSLGRLIDVLGSSTPTPGANAILTLDYNLQYEVENVLKAGISQYQADSGSITVMDPNNGAVLAMAGEPTFDPNNYGALTGDAQRAYLPPAISDVYEPGSVVKTLTMSAALNEGVVTPDTANNFNAPVTIDGHTIYNALNKIFGHENMTQVMENSDNIAMTWVSGLLGKEKQREYLDKFGFGKKTGIDLVGEQYSTLPELKNWPDILRANAAFGQGVATTTVNLAADYCAVADGGYSVTPHVVSKLDYGDHTETKDYPKGAQIISSQTATEVRAMLQAVVDNGEGKRARVAGMTVGGKTGTAQVPNPQGGYYTDRSIGTFIGMFPVDNPKYVMAVRVNNPKTVQFAESSAAPIFGTIADWMATYFQLR